MTFKRKIQHGLAVVTLASLPAPLAAQTALPCLTPGEAQAIISVTLPDIISGATTKCGPVNGATSFLSSNGRNLAERYRPTAMTAWPAARPALKKLAGPDGSLLDMMSDENLRLFSSTLVATAVLKSIDPRQCGDIDRIMRAVAPLPPENMSMLVGILLEIMARPKAQAAVAKTKSPINICPASTGSGQPVATK